MSNNWWNFFFFTKGIIIFCYNFSTTKTLFHASLGTHTSCIKYLFLKQPFCSYSKKYLKYQLKCQNHKMCGTTEMCIIRSGLMTSLSWNALGRACWCHFHIFRSVEHRWLPNAKTAALQYMRLSLSNVSNSFMWVDF